MAADELPRIDAAAAFLRAHGVHGARAALVLGSGAKDVAAHLAGAASLPLAQVPHWPVPGVAGHGAALVTGQLGGVEVACLSGRVHLYEGFGAREVVRAVRTLCRLGIRDFLLLNAAGGIAAELAPGDLMLVSDHINLTGLSPLTGPLEEALGPRFPDQSHVYAPHLRALLRTADPALHEGVYAGLQGPSYETPAEVRMLRTLGADAVGMSTVLEAIALHAMGGWVAAVSLISNLAAGIADHPLSHDEVLAAGRRAQARLTDLITAFCKALP